MTRWVDGRPRIVLLEPRRGTALGSKIFWTCAVRYNGTIHWYHGATPLHAMKIAVRACQEALAHDLAAELRK